jgi:hypothetical protein
VKFDKRLLVDVGRFAYMPAFSICTQNSFDKTILRKQINANNVCSPLYITAAATIFKPFEIFKETHSKKEQKISSFKFRYAQIPFSLAF